MANSLFFCFSAGLVCKNGWRLTPLLFGFIVQHAVAIAFEIGVCDLIAKLFAHAFGIRRMVQSARAVPAVALHGAAQTFHHFFIFVELYHIISPVRQIRQGLQNRSKPRKRSCFRS